MKPLCVECDHAEPGHERWCVFFERAAKPKRKKGEPVPLAEQAQDLADPNRRAWAKAVDLFAELEPHTETIRSLVDAIDALDEALASKVYADDETGEAKREALADAWEQAVEALQAIADGLEALESGL